MANSAIFRIYRRLCVRLNFRTSTAIAIATTIALRFINIQKETHYLGAAGVIDDPDLLPP